MKLHHLTSVDIIKAGIRYLLYCTSADIIKGDFKINNDKSKSENEIIIKATNDLFIPTTVSSSTLPTATARFQMTIEKK